MFGNWSDHFAANPALMILILASSGVLAALVVKSVNEWKLYGTIRFLSPLTKWGVAVLTGVVAVQIMNLSKPYVPPPSDQIALVLGNTQNTPRIALDSDIAAQIQETFLLHKGASAEEVADAIVLISAVSNPINLTLNTEDYKFEEIGINNANAKRQAKKNTEVLQTFINNSKPTDDGANYLEGILMASQNVEPGSRLLVIGSGLNDSGDLNFAFDNLLLDEKNREEALANLREKHGADALRGYTVTFYGLGDTSPPQEPLETKQKETIRDIYKSAIQQLGGRAIVVSRTRSGQPVETHYTVSTTDTNCGDVRLKFDDDAIKFVPNGASFLAPKTANNSLLQVLDIYEANPSRVRKITIDGFIASDTGGTTDETNLSGKRANTILQELEALGIPRRILEANGKGVGPHKNQNKNRMVKITIDRDDSGC